MVIRSVVGKVMWVGKATVFLVGLAMILALVFGVASTALGANGEPFLLGKKNVASGVSTLIKRGPGPALSLVVKAGQPPLKVNSQARVANLNAASAGRADSAESADSAARADSAANADKLDNKDSSEFLGKTEKAADADKLDGQDSDAFKPSYISPNGFPGAIDLDADRVVCATPSYSPNVAQKVRLDSWLSASPAASQAAWAFEIVHAYSTNNGVTWTSRGIPSTDGTDNEGNWAHATNTEHFSIYPGSSYRFGIMVRRPDQSSASDVDKSACELLAQFMLD